MTELSDKLTKAEAKNVNTELQSGRVNIFLPVDKIEKSKKDESDGTVTISGFASTPDLDFQGEQVDPLGIDDSYFKSQGWIDDEHEKTSVLGFPTDNTFVDPQKGLFVEAKLFKNLEGTQKFLKLYENLKKARVDRKLGFSIEGQINQRDATNPSIIRSVLITGVALTSNPADPYATWEVTTKSVMKSNLAALQAGHSINPADQTGGEALKPESLVHQLTDLSYGLSKFLACSEEKQKSIMDSVASMMDAKKDLNPEANVLFLQTFKGLSRNDASNIISNE